MSKKLITWVDLEGRFRRTALAYNDILRPPNETEDELIQRVWKKILTVPQYNLPPDHPYHVVDEEVLRLKVVACSGLDFRYPVLADVDGRHDAQQGAWEMDTDGCPKVNMPKARGVHMDKIRQVRNLELIRLDIDSLRAVEAGDEVAKARIATAKQTLRDIPQTFDLTTPNDTPEELKAMWPQELA